MLKHRRVNRLAAATDEASPHRPVALVHDYLLVMRGAERTFAAIADCWRDAPIYTLLYDAVAMAPRFGERRVHTSYLQRLGVRQSGFRRLLPLFPRAAEGLRVDRFPLVISSSSAFAHGVRAAPESVHVCYCHSPFRYAWHELERGLSEAPRPLRGALRRALVRIRRWDLAASRGVTHYIANSQLTRERIMRFYGRDASVVHPPVEVERFGTAAPEDFFLVVSELVPHKDVELALRAARRAGRRIKAVGDGPERRRLEALYGDCAEFLGRVSDAELASLYARATALVVPSIEEFGIAAVESQAAGRPVIAAGSGGALETVIENETGVFVRPGDPDELAEAMRVTDFDAFSPQRIVEHAHRFSPAAFSRRLLDEVGRLTQERNRGWGARVP